MRSAKNVQNTYGYRSDVWESAKAEAVLALKAKAKAKDLTTYGELTRQIVSIHFDPHEYNFQHFLGSLSIRAKTNCLVPDFLIWRRG